MIEDDLFLMWWERLCQRFKRPIEVEEAKLYHRFLTERMDGPTFAWAAEVVWSSREFFPRPIDFLTVAPKAEWAKMVALVMAGGGQPDDWDEISPRARMALRAIGGSGAISRDGERARRAYLNALEDGVAAEAGEQLGALKPAPGQLTLAEMTRRGRPTRVKAIVGHHAPRSPTSESYEDG